MQCGYLRNDGYISKTNIRRNKITLSAGYAKSKIRSMENVFQVHYKFSAPPSHFFCP
jgi:hypothetical protein